MAFFQCAASGLMANFPSSPATGSPVLLFHHFPVLSFLAAVLKAKNCAKWRRDNASK
jgi:hypothetical protein